MSHQNISAKHIAPTVRPDGGMISVIIPSAGIGSRIKSYGPKSLLKVNNNTCIVDNQINCLYDIFNRQVEIIVVGGFENNKLKKHINKTYSNNKNIIIVENNQYESTNVLDSIKIGLGACNFDRVMIINGDLVFNKETLKCPFGNDSMVILDKINGMMNEDEVGCTVDKHKLEYMMYGLSQKWAQISYFCGNELRLLKQIAKEKPMWFTFEAINWIMANGGCFYGYTPKNIKVVDIDLYKDLDKAKKII